MKKMVSLFMALVMVLSFSGMVSVSAMGAPARGAYGFFWYDNEAKGEHAQLYEYDRKKEAYRISDRVFVKGNDVYDIAGNLICNDLKGFTESEPTVAFDSKGYFYFISKSGELRRMESSLSNVYSVSYAKADYFFVDENDLVTSVIKDEEELTDIKDLTFKGSYTRHTTANPDKPIDTNVGAYVKMHSLKGDPETVVSDAYYKDKIEVTIYAYENKVAVETYKRALSTSSRGPKFCGFSAQYSVFVNDLQGNVYEYYYNGQYTKTARVLTNVEVYYFEKDSRGFVSSIIYKGGKYVVSTNVKFPGATDSSVSESTSSNVDTSTSFTGKVTSVRNFQSKAMAYDGSTHVGTLSLKSKKLYWRGTEMSYSEKSTEFGITANGTPVWINGEDDLYIFNGSSVQLIAKNVIRLKYDDDTGIVTEYKDATGNWYKV